MPSISPTCLSPADTKIQLLSKINNNLCLLFKTMSGGTFLGQLVYPLSAGGNQCGCTEVQMLSALNNNIALFFKEYSGGSADDPVDNTIHHWSNLEAVPTVGTVPDVIKIWVDDDAGIARITQLRTGTDATNTAQGIARPNDYNPAAPLCWYDKTG